MLHKFCIAPMIDYTDRHCRYFFRKLTKNAFLYSEMVVSEAIVYGDKDFFLKFDESEHPVALQIAGSNPKNLSYAAKCGEDFGYDEINFNLGCPSKKVQEGNFGACLMNDMDLVEDCLGSMIKSVSVPVTVKCRIGLDDDDPYEVLPAMIERLNSIGIKTIIIHARKAILNGLDPKKNREIPPLDYDLVRLIKRKWPELNLVLNGGINSIEKAKNIFPVICPFTLYPLEVYTHESLTTGPCASIEPPTAGFLFTVSGYLLKVSNSHNLVPVSELTA